MFRFNASLKKRQQTRRLQRQNQRRKLNDLISGKRTIEIHDDVGLNADIPQIQHSVSTNDSNTVIDSTAPRSTVYYNDEFDDYYLVEEHSSESKQSEPLYTNSKICVQEAVRKLVHYFIDFNLNKVAAVRLLRLTKEFLPSPNCLPTTWKSILKVLGFVSTSTKTFLCFRCFQRCEKSRNGRRICRNPRCKQAQKVLKATQLVEIIHLNIRSQIQTIFSRNRNFFNRSDLYPKTDVCFGNHYRNLNVKSINRVTLIVHTDGAPLVKLSKQNLWPCFASIVELPPPVRDYQNNILVLALWSSTIKPDPNIFLHQTVDELKHLIEHGTSIFIDGEEFEIKIHTQCFVSHLY